jgi:outer membrane lipoprotein-sorting protein
MRSSAYRHYVLVLLFFYLPTAFADNKATEWVKQATEHWRGQKSSYSVLDMTVHRPNLQRSMTLRLWTMGLENALVYLINPNVDKFKGHALLINHGKAWRFSPNTNKITPISLSDMTKNWMNSDFSNNEITKMEDLVEDYTHSLKRIDLEDQRVYLIEAKAKPEASVIWSKQLLKIREDGIILEQAFYNLQDKLVKKRITTQIDIIDGKPIATAQRMQRFDNITKWTEIVVKEIKFNIKVPRGTFSLSNLRNKRF